MGGPRAYTYRELLQTIAQRLDKRPLLLPLPFSIWHALARVAELLPRPPLVRNQVELMQIDTVAGPDMRGFGSLNMIPQDLGPTLDSILVRSAAHRA
jgi:NADH dehydrogenase